MYKCLHVCKHIYKDSLYILFIVYIAGVGCPKWQVCCWRDQCSLFCVCARVEYVCVRVCVYVGVFVHVYICIYMYTYIYIYIYIYIHIYIYVYRYVYRYRYTCTHVYIYTCIKSCTYIFIVYIVGFPQWQGSFQRVQCS